MKTAAKSKKLGLITLVGGGDTEIHIVPEEVIDWITSPLPKFGRTCRADDVLPANIQNMFDKAPEVELPISLTVGSPENDRAIYCGHIASHTAFSVKEAMEYCRKNGITIGKTYEGCSY